jgi:hypothetical protein
MRQGLLNIEASRSHSATPHSVILLWTSDLSDADTSTWQHTTLTRDRYLCLRPLSNPQSQQANGRRPTPLDRTATGIGRWEHDIKENLRDVVYENVEWWLQRVCKGNVNTLCNLHALFLRKVHIYRVFLSLFNLRYETRSVHNRVWTAISFEYWICISNKWTP